MSGENMMVPKLRFKEFYDEWGSNKLIKICEIFKGNLLSKADLSDNGIYECILYGELYTKYDEIIRKIYSKTNINSKNLIYSKFNDVIIPASGESSLDISRASCILKDNVILGGDLNILRPFNHLDGRFLSYVISNNKKIEIAKVAQGNSVVHLYADKIKNIKIEFPTFKEQVKIANTLELLDKKIEFQSKKIEVLKLYKKGIINNLYFNNTWEKKVFKNIYIKASEGGTPSTNILSNYQDGTIPFVKIADLNEKYLLNVKNYITLKGLNSSSAWIVPKKSIIFSNGATIGACSINKIDVATKQGILGIIPKENICSEFLYYSMISLSFRKQLKKIITKGTMECAYIKDIDNILLGVPSMDKQIHIIKPLIAIDKKIDNEIKKISNLSKFKKGLLQQMFV